MTLPRFKMKTWSSLLLVVMGLFFLSMLLAGSHGHLRFRPHRGEDWILFGLTGLTLGTGLLTLASKAYKRMKH
jgi:hypothetical protein